MCPWHPEVLTQQCLRFVVPDVVRSVPVTPLLMVWGRTLDCWFRPRRGRLLEVSMRGDTWRYRVVGSTGSGGDPFRTIRGGVSGACVQFRLASRRRAGGGGGGGIGAEP